MKELLALLFVIIGGYFFGDSVSRDNYLITFISTLVILAGIFVFLDASRKQP